MLNRYIFFSGSFSLSHKSGDILLPTLQSVVQQVQVKSYLSRTPVSDGSLNPEVHVDFIVCCQFLHSIYSLNPIYVVG